MLMVHKSFLLLLLMVAVVQSFQVNTTSTCSLKRLSQVIHKPGCVPKQVLSYACSGTCHSYSQVSPERHDVMHRNCECCREDEVHEASISLICRRKANGRPKFSRVTVPFVFPTSCLCRPCEVERAYEAQEFMGMAEEVKRLWQVLHA